MKILILGSSGFIGSHLKTELLKSGHQVISSGRKNYFNEADFLTIDLTEISEGSDIFELKKKLTTVDLVINAAGIIAETKTQSFNQIHAHAPSILFSLCRDLKIKVIQISALGADAEASSLFHLSKRKADDFLINLNIPSAIIYPSLIFGKQGKSAELFTQMSSLPIIFIPDSGNQKIQPIHIDDLVNIVKNIVDHFPVRCQKFFAVGPDVLEFKQFLNLLRISLNLRPALVIHLPMIFISFCAFCFEKIGFKLINRDTVKMLSRGNFAHENQLQLITYPAQIKVNRFIDQEMRENVFNLKIRVICILARFAVAMVWIWTGIVSLGIYPISESLQLLGQVGLTGKFALFLLYFASLLDLFLGLLLILKKRKILYILQLLVICSYSLIISFKIPEFWIHPFGPLLKNIPLVVLTLMLLFMEDENAVFNN